MNAIIISIVALIAGVCATDLKIENCEQRVNECLDKKIWDYRERLSDPSDETIITLLNECKGELK